MLIFKGVAVLQPSFFEGHLVNFNLNPRGVVNKQLLFYPPTWDEKNAPTGGLMLQRCGRKRRSEWHDSTPKASNSPPSVLKLRYYGITSHVYRQCHPSKPKYITLNNIYIYLNMSMVGLLKKESSFFLGNNHPLRKKKKKTSNNSVLHGTVVPRNHQYRRSDVKIQDHQLGNLRINLPWLNDPGRFEGHFGP